MHLARQPALDREVALKELHSAHVRDAAFAHRFLNESRVAGALNHPSVVSVIEYFEHEGVPFIAMEYLERGSLRPLVGQLTLAQVAGVLDSVLGGLAEAAAQGIVHRDLKPENVLVTADGHAKVADFGIAKAIGQVCMTDFRTATGQIVGTPAYMAPEQISGGEITPQVDLYATGLIAYELLAGRHPFDGTDAPMALLMRHVNDDPPPLASVRPDLPPGVVAWVHAMLAKDPAARPAGAAHAWDRLEGVVSDALGPRWRRAALLTELGRRAGRGGRARAAERAVRDLFGRPAARARAGAERVGADGSGPAFSEPAPAATRTRALHAGAARTRAPRAGAARDPLHPAPVPPEPVDPAPVPPARVLPAPVHTHRVPAFPMEPQPLRSAPEHPAPLARGRRPRVRTLVLALAGALLVAVAAIMYSTAPGEEPRAAPRPAGPSLDERVRTAVAPALADDAKLSRELSSLVPGASPGDARDRASAAIPATNVARTAVERAARDRRRRAPPARPRATRAERAVRLPRDRRGRVGAAGRRRAARSPRSGLGAARVAARADRDGGSARVRDRRWRSPPQGLGERRARRQAPPPPNPAAPAPQAQPLQPPSPHRRRRPRRRRPSRRPTPRRRRRRPPPSRRAVSAGRPSAAAALASGASSRRWWFPFRPSRPAASSPAAASARTRAAAGRRRRAGRARDRSRRWPAPARRACARTAGSPPGRS